MHEKYCEWCGSVLIEDGHCPINDCAQNVLIDELAKAEEEDKHKYEDNKNDSNQAV